MIPRQLNLFNRLQKSNILLRFYATTTLSHINRTGKIQMVDINNKNITVRHAKAQGTVNIGPEITKLINENKITKGNVLVISEIAGIIGAKKTSELIPLCHNINISSIQLNTELNFKKNQIIISSMVNCDGKTGVEMEALTAVAIAALTIYDMCKAVSHDIIINDIKLITKTGGKSDFKRNENINDFKLNYKKEPIDCKEIFYPEYF